MNLYTLLHKLLCASLQNFFTQHDFHSDFSIPVPVLVHIFSASDIVVGFGMASLEKGLITTYMLRHGKPCLGLS